MISSGVGGLFIVNSHIMSTVLSMTMPCVCVMLEVSDRGIFAIVVRPCLISSEDNYDALTRHNTHGGDSWDTLRTCTSVVVGTYG